jgi:hypothetical protein
MAAGKPNSFDRIRISVACGVTERDGKGCIEFLRIMRAARWPTTGQIRRRFFAASSADAARKRLRREASRHLYRIQEHRARGSNEAPEVL